MREGAAHSARPLGHSRHAKSWPFPPSLPPLSQPRGGSCPSHLRAGQQQASEMLRAGGQVTSFAVGRDCGDGQPSFYATLIGTKPSQDEPCLGVAERAERVPGRRAAAGREG